ncbi:MAG: hypothetical protein R3B99_30395 [Polyangiales bacterium]
MRTAGWLAELTDPLLAVFQESATANPDEDARHRSPAALLPRVRHRGRRAATGAISFFLHDADEPASARDLVVRLSSVTPELGPVTPNASAPTTDRWSFVPASTSRQ